MVVKFTFVSEETRKCGQENDQGMPNEEKEVKLFKDIIEF
jgi:hypothetical protein